MCVAVKVGCTATIAVAISSLSSSSAPSLSASASSSSSMIVSMHIIVHHLYIFHHGLEDGGIGIDGNDGNYRIGLLLRW